MTRLPPDLEDKTPSLSASFEGAPKVSPADKVPRMELSQRPAEETSLERRVLAHERILQIVVAHLVENEPNLLSRLNEVFVTPVKMDRCEHDYTNTEGFAEECIRAIILIKEHK